MRQQNHGRRRQNRGPARRNYGAGNINKNTVIDDGFRESFFNLIVVAIIVVVILTKIQF